MQNEMCLCSAYAFSNCIRIGIFGCVCMSAYVTQHLRANTIPLLCFVELIRGRGKGGNLFANLREDALPHLHIHCVLCVIRTTDRLRHRHYHCR